MKKPILDVVLGKQIRVCGSPIDPKQKLICTLPHDIGSKDPHKIHAAVFINADLEICLVYKAEEGSEPVWLGVEDPDV